MRTLESLIRKNIYNLKPYACARDEFKGEASVYLDANENPLNAPFNRYPDPLQWELKTKISAIKKIATENIMLGNGSDEPIDLIYRIFCEPTVDNVVAIAPSYGMYGVCADVNNVEYRQVLLTEDFQLDATALLAATDKNTKVIWLCSPNNPSGNLLQKEEITKVLNGFDGIVVIDEAYVDFSSEESWLTQLNKYPKLIVLQTFSKAWGMAALRCGMAFASQEIIGYFNKVKYPYNVNILTQKTVLEQIAQEERKNQWVTDILNERTRLITEMKKLTSVKHIYPTDANFVLVKMTDANATYKALVERGTIVRNRSSVKLCGNCLRITIGTKDENNTLISQLKEIEK